MRNLKRALSLALASVMLLGMMVIGTSAATFTDADEIVNTEAATITAGLGLFAGSEGKFNPTGKVTRAQMATVIVKMLYGSEINADSYKGAGKFSDIASFEGGWAEGYINLCANLGIVSGYGDGTFKPGKELTTAEAITMLLNALKVDAGEGTWPMTVMSAAEKIELYEDMVTAKPTTNEALTRDQLSVLVWNALNYSADEKVGYTVDGVTYSDYMEAFLAAGGTLGGGQPTKEITIAKPDTLADTVFGLKSTATPVIITGNQATGEDYTVVNGGTAIYNIETGLDLIGHAVTVYYESAYKNDKEPGVAYAVVDENATVVVAMPDGKIDTRAEYRAAFGSQVVAEAQANNADAVRLYQNYSANGTGSINNFNISGTTYYVPNGTYVIDEDTNTIVAYHAPTNVEASMVTKVTTTEGKESITVLGYGALDNTEDDGIVVAYEGIAKDDLVAVVKQGDLYVLSKLDTVTGKVTALSKNKDNNRDIVTMNGQNYEFFGGTVKATNELNTTFSGQNGMTFTKEYTLYLYDGKLVGYDTAAASADVSDVIYVVDTYNTDAKDAYGKTTVSTYVQGVDMDGKEVNILVNMTKDTVSVFSTDANGNLVNAAEKNDADTWVVNDGQNNAVEKTGYYTFEKVEDRDAAKEGIMAGTAIAKTESDEDLFYANVAYDSNFAKIDADSTRIKVNYNDTTDDQTANGTIKNAYITAGSKLIKAVGTGSTIETSLSASFKYSVPATVEAGAERAVALLSMDDAGNYVLEAIVVTSANSITVAEDVIYVSAEQVKAPINSIEDGYVYEVYNAKTGEILTLTMASQFSYSQQSPLANVGFYEYEYDEAEKNYSTVGNKDSMEGAYYNKTFTGLYNGLITAGDMYDWNAANAIIVDTRDDDAKDLIPEITTLADLLYTSKVTGEDCTIVLDIWASDVEDEVVGVIYIRSVTPNTYNYTISGSNVATQSGSAVQGARVDIAAATGYKVTAVAIANDKADVQQDATGYFFMMPAEAVTVTVTTEQIQAQP